MKNLNPVIGLVSGTLTPSAKLLCEELAQQGSSVIVESKPEAIANSEHIRQLTGQAGQDLFFNGWKLLF